MRKIIILLIALLMPLSFAGNTQASEEFRSKLERVWDYVKPGGYVPKAANNAVRELDEQLLKLLGYNHSRSELRIAFTVSANLDDLTRTNALARQMSEEVARGLKQKGYKILEIRKSTAVTMTPGVGELFLTRERANLSKQSVAAELIMAGTYTVSTKGIRFNIRLIHMDSTEVIAMATTTVPMYPEIKHLLEENIALPPLGPTVGTKLSM